MNINHLDSVKLDVGTNTNLAEIKFKSKMVWINSYSYFVAIFSVSAIQISTKLATLRVSRVADKHPFSKQQIRFQRNRIESVNPLFASFINHTQSITETCQVWPDRSFVLAWHSFLVWWDFGWVTIEFLLSNKTPYRLSWLVFQSHNSQAKPAANWN